MHCIVACESHLHAEATSCHYCVPSVWLIWADPHRSAVQGGWPLSRVSAQHCVPPTCMHAHALHYTHTHTHTWPCLPGSPPPSSFPAHPSLHCSTSRRTKRRSSRRLAPSSERERSAAAEGRKQLAGRAVPAAVAQAMCLMGVGRSGVCVVGLGGDGGRKGCRAPGRARQHADLRQPDPHADVLAGVLR